LETNHFYQRKNGCVSLLRGEKGLSICWVVKRFINGYEEIDEGTYGAYMLPHIKDQFQFQSCYRWRAFKKPSVIIPLWLCMYWRKGNGS